MKRKFSVGDMVVVKKAFSVVDYPGKSYSDTLRNEIMSKTTIRRVGSYWASSPTSVLVKPGTVGIVKGYQNVFLLSHRYLSERSYQALAPAKKKDVIIDEKYNKQYLLNLSGKKHMLVLIEDQLVAIENAARYFESSSDALRRFSEVTIKFGGEIKLKNASLAEIDKRIGGKLRQLRSFLDKSSILEEVFKDRHGIIVNPRQPQPPAPIQTIVGDAAEEPET